jgi:DNA-binding FadR family transcriptional regulator
LRTLRSCKEPRAFQRAVREYRHAVNDEYAGPRLHAAIRASQGLIPRAFLSSYPTLVAEMLPFYEDETAAIQHRDPDGARAACSGCAALMAEVMVAELIRRGVLAPSDKRAAVL